MKLLFDENLSPKLAEKLSELFPESTHVDRIGLGRENDLAVWEYAMMNDFIIVTKDSDFNDLSVIEGYPPFVVWRRKGNCSTNEILTLIEKKSQNINEFVSEGKQGLLILF